MSVYGVQSAWGASMPPRAKPTSRKPVLPKGYKHFGEWADAIRLDADIPPREIETMTAAYGLDRRIERSYFERIASNQRPPSSVGPRRLEALRVVLKQDRETWAFRTGVDIPTGAQLEPATFTASRLTPDLVAAREAAVQDFLADLRPADYHPVFSSGAGGPFRDDEDPIEHIQIPNTISDRYPSAVYMRVDGDCLEPAIQRGVYAAILPDAALATAGSLVCVWFSDNGRKFAYLWESREDGDHVLVQTNPPETVYAPLGSVILGVVVDTYNAPAAPKLKARELVNIITKTAPHLLED